MKLKYSKKFHGYIGGFLEESDSKCTMRLSCAFPKSAFYKLNGQNILKILKKYHTVYLNNGSINEVVIWLDKDDENCAESLHYGNCGARYYDIVQHTVCRKTDRHIERIISRRKNPNYEGDRSLELIPHLI